MILKKLTIVCPKPAAVTFPETETSVLASADQQILQLPVSRLKINIYFIVGCNFFH